MKAKIAQNNSQVSEGRIAVKPGQDSIHELIIWKVSLFVASVTCSRYLIAFKWLVNFQMKFLLRHSSNSRKLYGVPLRTKLSNRTHTMKFNIKTSNRINIHWNYKYIYRTAFIQFEITHTYIYMKSMLNHNIYIEIANIYIEITHI